MDAKDQCNGVHDFQDYAMLHFVCDLRCCVCYDIMNAFHRLRLGRAGRLEGTGHAYRLYSSAVFDQQFAPFREVSRYF